MINYACINKKKKQEGEKKGVLTFKKGEAFLFKKIGKEKSVGVTAEPHQNPNTLDLRDSSNPKFNDGSRSV